MFGGTRDSFPTIVCAGIISPGLIVCIVAVNFAFGAVAWPHRFGFDVYTDPTRFCALVLFKLGVAGALVAWYVLGNLPRAERFAAPLTIVTSFAAAVAFGVFFVSLAW